jgi:hypothetical protein
MQNPLICSARALICQSSLQFLQYLGSPTGILILAIASIALPGPMPAWEALMSTAGFCPLRGPLGDICDLRAIPIGFGPPVAV